MMAAELKSVVRPEPIPGVCAFYVEKKNRFCKFLPIKKEKFCIQHLPRNESGEVSTTVLMCFKLMYLNSNIVSIEIKIKTQDENVYHFIGHYVI